MGITIKIRSLRMLMYVFLLVSLITSPGFSSDVPTLYARSLKSFETRVVTADPENYRFIFIGDSRGNDRKFKQILQRARELKPLFILHGGDIVEKGGAEELSRFLETVSSVKELPPLFVVRGNHEQNSALFEKMIGPLNFVIDSRRLGLRLVAVDNSQYVLNDRERNFLEKYLDRTIKYQFVSMHIPPKSERWPKHSFEKGKVELLRILTARNVRMGLFSHIHVFDSEVINGIPLVVSGGAGAQLAWIGYSGDVEYHMVIVDVVKGRVSFRTERFDTELLSFLP